MKKKWFQISFALSLVFNVAAIVAVVYSLYFIKPVSSHKPDMLAAYDRLHLTEEQKQEFWNGYVEIVRSVTASQGQYKTKWAEVAQLISDPKPDWKAVEAKQAEILSLGRENQTVIFERWNRAKTYLTPEQQRLFYEILQERIKSGEMLGEFKAVQENVNKKSTKP